MGFERDDRNGRGRFAPQDADPDPRSLLSVRADAVDVAADRAKAHVLVERHIDGSAWRRA